MKKTSLAVLVVGLVVGAFIVLTFGSLKNTTYVKLDDRLSDYLGV